MLNLQVIFLDSKKCTSYIFKLLTMANGTARMPVLRDYVTVTFPSPSA